MRVGYVIGALRPGGSERQLSELASGLAARGHVVEIATYDGAGEFDALVREQGVVLRTMHGRTKREKLRLVRTWVHDFEPNVLHGFMKRASSLAALANQPKRGCCVIASDFSTATYSRSQPALWASLAMFALADRVVTQTEMNRRSICLLAPWLRKKTVVIRNGVDTERFKASEAADPRLAAPFRFLSVGTVYRLKNPVRVAEAVKILHDRGLEFSVDWVGPLGQGGSQSEDYQRASAFVRDYGLERYLRFLGPSSRMEEVYHRYDALLHVSVQDGIPNAVVEGMACGLPVVVSRVSDLPMIVSEARNGFVCDERDPVSIAVAMQRMIESAGESRGQMARGSRELAVRWFGLERFLDDYEAIYRGLVET